MDAIHKLKQKYPDLKIYTQFEGKMRYDQFIEVVKGTAAPRIRLKRSRCAAL